MKLLAKAPEDRYQRAGGLLSDLERCQLQWSAHGRIEPFPLAAARIFLGHAGWAPGQLDGELSAGAWIVIDAMPQDVFSSAPERLWSAVLRRLPGEAAFLSTRPDDPNLN